ncbi:MAG: oxaloacetate decarboxylase [Lachnospiraceae bacterium]|nr:oxaloacetate decarboxylase [Lachnospiraceae bacterium]
MKKIVGIALTVIGIVIVAISLIFKVNEQMTVARSISIIDKADGPTSIFIAGKIGGTSIFIGVIAGIVLLMVGIFIIVRKK